MEQDTLWSHETELSADTGSVARARAFVLQHLIEHRLLYLVDEVRLVAGELAMNAVVGTHAAFTVILEGREDSVRLTVRDGSPASRASSGAARQGVGTAGLGLVIANLMSEDWGIERGGPTESVWASFELRARAVT